jgi:hypothetical protein
MALAILIEGPLDLLHSLSDVPGVELGDAERIDASSEILHGPIDDRTQRAALVIGLVAAILSTADAVMSISEHIHRYVNDDEDKATVVRVVDPGSGETLVVIDSTTPPEKITEALTHGR